MFCLKILDDIETQYKSKLVSGKDQIGVLINELKKERFNQKADILSFMQIRENKRDIKVILFCKQLDDPVDSQAVSFAE